MASPPRLDLPSASRYEPLVKIAAGGMATVFAGQLRSAAGFRRLVAIKKAHKHIIREPGAKRMLMEEARLAARIHHPNVVAVLDVEDVEGELLLVMDYIEGASLAEVLARRGKSHARAFERIVVRVLLDACAGLTAAHELADDSGAPLGIIHRDVSPQNVLIGVDGNARLTDFGIAKCSESIDRTKSGELKGKAAYLAPEYVHGAAATQRSDVFSMGIVAWESLSGFRLFPGEDMVETFQRIISPIPPPRVSTVAPSVGRRFDAAVAKALAKAPEDRTASCRELMDQLEAAGAHEDGIASHREVAAWVSAHFGEQLAKRRVRITEAAGAARALPADDDAPPTERDTARGD